MPKKQEKVPEQPERKPVTKEEKLIQHLETVSPKQLLEDLSGGNRASEQDMRVVREVMTGQGLPPPRSEERRVGRECRAGGEREHRWIRGVLSGEAGSVG